MEKQPIHISCACLCYSLQIHRILMLDMLVLRNRNIPNLTPILLLVLYLWMMPSNTLGQAQTITPQAHSVGELKYSLPTNSSQAKARYQSMEKEHLALTPSHILSLPKLDYAALKQEGDEQSYKLKIAVIGKNRQVVFHFADYQDPVALEDQTGVWLAGIQSTGALAMRIHFTGLDLPTGSELLVYAPNDREHAQPITEKGMYKNGNFWTGLILGDTAVLELRGDATALEKLQVPEIAHLYQLPWTANSNVADPAAPCNVDASCYPTWSQTGDATSMYAFQGYPYTYACSGTLINNANQDYSPLYLTANHCTSAPNAELDTALFYWFYKTTTCNDPTTVNIIDISQLFSGDEIYTGYGATVLNGASLGTSSDFSLMQINTVLPNGVVFAGWNRDPFPLNSAITGIHYPEASYRRIMQGTTIPATGQIPGVTPMNFIGVTLNLGMGEPGSSGSPLLDSNHEIVGTLTGGSASCAAPTAEIDYGRFEISAPQMVWSNPANGQTQYNLLDQGLPDDAMAPNQSRNQAAEIPFSNSVGKQAYPNLILKWKRDYWYHIKVPVFGYLTAALNLSNPNQGHVYVEVFQDTATTPFIPVFSPPLNSPESQISFQIPFDYSVHDYYVHAYLEDGQRIEFELDLYFYMQPPDPVLVTNPVPTGTYPNISISGTINPNGSTYNVSLLAAPCVNFNAGACLSWGAAYQQVSGNNVLTVQGPLINLYPCTKYYYTIQTFQIGYGRVLNGGVYTFLTDGPCISLSSSTVDFGRVLYGLSTTRAITISNTGDQPLILNSIQYEIYDPEINIQQNCQGSVATGSSCTVQLSYTPAGIGYSLTNYLAIHHNSINNMNVIPISGNGVDWIITTSRPTRQHVNGNGALSAGQNLEIPISYDVNGNATGEIELGCTGAPAGMSCTVIPAVIHVRPGHADSAAVATIQIAPKRTSRLQSHTSTDQAGPPRAATYPLHLVARVGKAVKIQDIYIEVLP